MFMLLLQAAQQASTLAKQVSPNLYVTVQPSPGMPEWVKILITAAVGALVGIASNIAMEYVKPGIVKRQKRKLIAQHLNAELCANMSAIAAAKRVLEGLMKDSTRDKGMGMDSVGRIAASIRRDRYDLYFSEEKDIVYEIDKNLHLADFYAVFNPAYENAVFTRHCEHVVEPMSRAERIGGYYIAEAKIAYQSQINAAEEAYWEVLKGEGGS